MEISLFGAREAVGTTPAMKLSDAQKEAVTELDKNLCVSAGAGSGKTTVLVERFLQIVTERKVRPDRVVAITYTDKAASNMKEKLVHVFMERGLFEERHVLENAYIGTIHSIAARILRENPVEAGVDPNFIVVDNEKAEVLMDEVLDEILEETALSESFFDLLRHYGEENVRKGLVLIYKKVRSLGSNLESILTELPQPKALEAWQKLSARLRRFLAEGAERNSKTRESNLKAASALLSQIPGEELEPTWQMLHEWATLGHFDKRVKAQSAAIDEVRMLFEEALRREIEKMATPFKKSLLALDRLFSERFALRKAETKGLDFDDLLIRAYQLFASEEEMKREVRKRYQERFAYILVDEFQDTSRLQARWIDTLAHSSNLFIVGDAKQSIYRFRNADWAGFLEKEREMAGQNNGRRLSLSENHRSRKEILEFINGLFGAIWKEDSFRFEPLKPQRSFEPKDDPSVELICVEHSDEEEKEEELSMDEARIREARILAHHLRDLVEKKRFKVTERKGTARDVAYGDIAILFRAMTSSSIYERELKEGGIPYFVVQGRGFYEKQEIADLVDFLSLLERIDQDIPLAAVLRSPLFGLSEDALFWISRVKKEEETLPLSKGLETLDRTKLAKEDRGKLAVFMQTFQWLQARKDQFSISELLEILVERTHYDVKLLGKPDGKRKYANVLKLLELAREFEMPEAFGLPDFLRYVKKLSLQEAKESEAPIELEKGDAVKLLTIHQAKGLEFPVVVVADLGRKLKNQTSFWFNFTPTYGLGFQVKNPFTRIFEKSDTFLKNKEEDEREGEEELKRIFYVALTRAEEHLILSGARRAKSLEGKSYRELPTFMEWLEKALGENLNLKVFPVPGPQGGRRGDKALCPADASPFKEAIQKLCPIEGQAMSGLIEDPATPFTAGALIASTCETKKEYFETRNLSVSALLKYMDCPGCYFDLYERHAPDEMLRGGEEEEEFGEDEGPLLARREFGNFFHRIMQYVNFRDASGESLQFHLAEIQPFLSEGEVEELRCSARNFLEGEWGRLLREAEIYRELPFIYKLSCGKLRGQIDLVAKTRESEWLVLDYKTGRLEDEGELQAKAREHELQIFTYALALHDAGGISPSRGVLYFTSLDRAVSYDLAESALEATRKQIEACFEAIVQGRGPYRHRESCWRFQHEYV